MLSVLLFSSCGGKSKTASVIEAEKAIPLRYAENLSLSATEDYTIARLRNPWDTTRILHTYVLVDKEKSLPADLPEGTLVRTPLSKAVVYSSVHCGLLNQIGALKSIGGVCDLKYIKLQEVQDGCRTGSIADVGNGMNPDIEKIIDLHPDAIMLSPFENTTAFGSKAIVDRFRNEGVQIDSVIGIGGIALKSPFVMQTLSDVLNMPIKVCKTDQACALGAAMFAATAAGVYNRVEDAQKAMSSGFAMEYTPNAANAKLYEEIYRKYLKVGEFTEKALFC